MKLRYAPVLFVLLFILTACTSDQEGATRINDMEKIGITVPVTLPADLYGEEGYGLAGLEVVVFEKQDHEYIYSYTTDSFTGYSDSRFTVRLDKTECPVRLMLLTHAEGLPAREQWVAGSTTLEEVRASLVRDLGTEGKWDEEATIPMWGESSDFIVSDNNKTLTEISLLRMMSAIHVTFSEQITAEEFELSEVRLYNACTNGLLVPDPANLDGSGKRVTAPSLPSIPDMAGYIVLGENLDNNTLPPVYVCETGTTGADPDRRDVPFLLLGGYYHGEATQTWYRVDLFTEDDGGNKNYRPLLRNKLNRISVTGVGNRGDEDEQDAIGREKADMDIELYEWEVTEGNILLYGHNVFTVSRNNIVLSKEANELVQVTVFTDYYGGWSARVPDQYAGWITLVSPEPDGGGASFGEPNVQTTLGFAVGENTTGAPRSGEIRITVGDRVDFSLVVMQEENEMSLSVTDASGDTVQELVFASNRSNRNVAAQKITVDWMPGTEICLMTLTPGSDPFVFDTDHDHPSDGVWVLEGGSRELSIRPVPFTQAELAENPYRERTSSVDFIVATANSYRKHTVVLRHINYHLELGELGPSYRIGKTYEIDILTNADDWRVTTYDYHGAFKRDVVANTDRNTVTVEMNDDPLKADWIGGFFLYSTKAGVNGSVYGNMRSYDPFPTSFILRPGESIDVQITGIQAFWRDWLGKPILPENNSYDNYTDLSFEVLWQTSPKRMIAPIPDLRIWFLNNYADSRDYRNCRFNVQVAPDADHGSAVLAAYHNNRIVWTWHLWITDYDPDTDNIRYTHSGTTDVTLMTRNLGAVSNVPNDVNSIGFYFQWGRKDPFPGPASYGQGNQSAGIRPIYDGAGNPISGIDGNYLTPALANPYTNLERTVTDPLIFIQNTGDPGDWYSSDAAVRNDYLWIDEEGEKSIFDPCPAGWRVPYMKNGRSPWFNISSVGASNNVYNWQEVGWYPTSGLRQDTGRFNSLTFLHTWMAGTAAARAQGFRAANGINGTNTYQRSAALVVRCMKDD